MDTKVRDGGPSDVAGGRVAGDVLADVRGLKMYFPTPSGSLFGHGDTVRAVDDVSFSVLRGETLGLVGESGSGKSTIGRCLLGLYKPTAGQVLLEGNDLSTANRRQMKRIRKDVQAIFQDPFSSLDPRMTVEQLLVEPLIIHDFVERKDRTAYVQELLSRVGMNAKHAARYPHQLSGGQRQRVAIARALAIRPAFVVCDEPVSALDVSVQAQVLNLFEDLQQELGLTYLFIAHDLSVVRHIANRVAIMYLGHIVEIADRDEIFDHPQHPYTQALLSAAPIPDPVKELQRQRIILSGEIPSPSHKPKGCVFSQRCPIAIPACQDEMPPLQETRPAHWAACIRAGEVVPSLPVRGSDAAST
jgi:oligopeptide/dipeptide ABC transporter ATP-binding protein